MNWNYQRKQVKPTAKCCLWCKHFSSFYCPHPITRIDNLTHRLVLKMLREGDVRYCKDYRYSKSNFKAYKAMCEENAKLTEG